MKFAFGTCVIFGSIYNHETQCGWVSGGSGDRTIIEIENGRTYELHNSQVHLDKSIIQVIENLVSL